MWFADRHTFPISSEVMADIRSLSDFENAELDVFFIIILNGPVSFFYISKAL